MFRKVLIGAAGAGLLAASYVAAGAAPLQAPSAGATAPGAGVTQVHGFHRDCRRGPGGWHRHNKWGERRACRAWRGQGKRPDFCVKIGALYYCDY